MVIPPSGQSSGGRGGETAVGSTGGVGEGRISDVATAGESSSMSPSPTLRRPRRRPSHSPSGDSGFIDGEAEEGETEDEGEMEEEEEEEEEGDDESEIEAER